MELKFQGLLNSRGGRRQCCLGFKTALNGTKSTPPWARAPQGYAQGRHWGRALMLGIVALLEMMMLGSWCVRRKKLSLMTQASNPVIPRLDMQYSQYHTVRGSNHHFKTQFLTILQVGNNHKITYHQRTLEKVKNYKYSLYSTWACKQNFPKTQRNVVLKETNI